MVDFVQSSTVFISISSLSLHLVQTGSNLTNSQRISNSSSNMQQEITCSKNNIISSSSVTPNVIDEVTSNIQIEHDYTLINQNERYSTTTLMDESHIIKTRLSIPDNQSKGKLCYNSNSEPTSSIVQRNDGYEGCGARKNKRKYSKEATKRKQKNKNK
ncbi:unnamed protein product [Rotaria sordida]|uniref:Uncharacterized protein n=1 Tax=Rotaria sordida TaxID=392033 RepID=A0A815WVX8_9BILA|nr:unnamed protein product [Rotaria sordida]CAF1551058.1 unnamed protein product [Rotaria sordida]